VACLAAEHIVAERGSRRARRKEQRREDGARKEHQREEVISSGSRHRRTGGTWVVLTGVALKWLWKHCTGTRKVSPLDFWDVWCGQ
jgi:hypothetical protein